MGDAYLLPGIVTAVLGTVASPFCRVGIALFCRASFQGGGRIGSGRLGAFGLGETHGILRQPGNEFVAGSERLNWTSVFASIQRERPYEESFAAVPDHLIILHLDGYVKVDRWVGVSRESRMIAPGGMFMVPGGIDFRVRLGDPLSTIHFYLRRAMLAEVARDLCRGDPDRLEFLPRIGESDPLLERIIFDIRQELLDPDQMGDTYVDYLARAAAARLVRAHSSNASRVSAPLSIPGEAHRKIARATEYVNAYLHRPIRLEELARELDVSASQLTLLFKKTLGDPPHRYILKSRVQRAREMLKASNLPLAEVALACGFSHQEHMSRIFRREIGTTPAAYRRGLD
jgi:AraC family transcriptional regulator